MEKQIIYYYNVNGECPYQEWFDSLDKSIQLRVDKRVEKLRTGLYGDHHSLQKYELSELRMDFGKGYRIYYYDLDTTLILFFGGSEKKDQKHVVKKCNDYFNDFIERNS